MTEYVRQQKVYELNRLLPKVRETIKKERHVRELEDLLDTKNDLLEKVTICITQLNELPKLISEVSTMPDSVKENFDVLRKHQEQEKISLESSIESYSEEIAKLSEELEFDTGLYKAIIHNLVMLENGFMNKDDIKKEFLPEYLYLLIFDTSFNKRLTLKTLLQTPADKDAFYNLVYTSFPPDKAEILESIYKGDANKALFFKLCID